MSNYNCKYKVRVLLSGKYGEVLEYYSDYDSALSHFLFYVNATIELSLSVRAINLIKGNKSIKMFQNH